MTTCSRPTLADADPRWRIGASRPPTACRCIAVRSRPPTVADAWRCAPAPDGVPTHGGAPRPPTACRRMAVRPDPRRPADAWRCAPTQEDVHRRHAPAPTLREVACRCAAVAHRPVPAPMPRANALLPSHRPSYRVAATNAAEPLVPSPGGTCTPVIAFDR